MLSIIISTYKPAYLEALKKNIEETVFLEYEIIAIENNNKFSICEAYNIGADRAIFPYLCFLHEDIKIRTLNWPTLLINRFKDDDLTGLIGVAGTTYKTLAPGGWNNDQPETNRLNIIQHYKSGEQPRLIEQTTQDFEEVACVDGVFLFTKRSIWEQNKFDQNTFTDFHCYDLDFSLNVQKKYKVLVTNQILLEHFSPGFLNEKWVEESIKLATKWKHILPIGTLDKKMQYHIEWKQKIWFLSQMVRYNQDFKNTLNVYFGYGFFKFFSVIFSLKALKRIMQTYFYLKKSV